MEVSSVKQQAPDPFLNAEVLVISDSESDSEPVQQSSRLPASVDVLSVDEGSWSQPGADREEYYGECLCNCVRADGPPAFLAVGQELTVFYHRSESVFAFGLRHPVSQTCVGWLTKHHAQDFQSVFSRVHLSCVVFMDVPVQEPRFYCITKVFGPRSSKSAVLSELEAKGIDLVDPTADRPVASVFSRQEQKMNSAPSSRADVGSTSSGSLPQAEKKPDIGDGPSASLVRPDKVLRQMNMWGGVVSNAHLNSDDIFHVGRSIDKENGSNRNCEQEWTSTGAVSLSDMRSTAVAFDDEVSSKLAESGVLTPQAVNDKRRTTIQSVEKVNTADHEWLRSVDIFTSSEELAPAPQPPVVTTPMHAYQLEALGWMLERERDARDDEDEDRISSLERYVCCGGILADEMGLGKSLQMISLVCSDLIKGPTLIVCPLSVMSQWSEQVHKHVRKGAVKVYEYHGPNRLKDGDALMDYDIILTTYSLVAYEFRMLLRKARAKLGLTPKEALDLDSPEVDDVRRSGRFTWPLLCAEWERVILDEAHMIKGLNTQTSTGCSFIPAQSRWCVTGTPVQNNLDDLFALVRFLRVHPYESKQVWDEYVGLKGDREKEERLSRLRHLLRHICLRRTKRCERVNIPLPPKYVERRLVALSLWERQLYDTFLISTRERIRELAEKNVLMKNYTAVLVLLLRLRQLCDHPYLCMGRNHVEGLSKVEVKGDVEKVVQASLRPSADDAENAEAHQECECCKKSFGVSWDTADSENDVAQADEQYIAEPCKHVICRGCRDSGDKRCRVCNDPVRHFERLNPTPVRAAVPSNPTADFVFSAKLSLLIEDIKANHEQSGIKGVVFSQFTSMLDLVEDGLQSQTGMKYVRLDGSYTMSKRKTSLTVFKTDSRCKLLLMSLKAGNVGLDLSCASRVYLLDPWWNPAVDDQAIDRVHRLGQDKSVSVYRYAVRNSIDEKMLELQQKKRELCEDTVHAVERMAQGRAQRTRELESDILHLFSLSRL